MPPTQGNYFSRVFPIIEYIYASFVYFYLDKNRTSKMKFLIYFIIFCQCTAGVHLRSGK
jgi:hypothetical protein